MTSIDISNFQYPPRGYVYPSSACNATWLDTLQANNLDLSYPPNNPVQSQILFTAGMICRFNDNPKISDLAWHVYSTLTAFGYRPSLGFGIFALVVFSLSCTWHGWQLIRTRAWVMIPVVIGAGLEIYGWTNRELANSDPRFYYVPQLAVLTIAPTFFSCSVYSLFQIMVRYIDPQAAIGPRPKTAMWIWIALDFCTLVVQATGGGLAATADATSSLFESGSDIMLAGIILQLLVAIIFSVVAVAYFRRVNRKAPCGNGYSGHRFSLNIKQPVGRFVWGVGVIQGCIIARGIYRVAELAGGLYSSVARSQGAMITLDALPMMVAVVTLNVIHPEFVLPKTWWRGQASAIAAEERLQLGDRSSEADGKA